MYYSNKVFGLQPGTMVIMSDGKTKKVEEFCVGDYVMGLDNLPKKVLRLFSGKSEMYTVKQTRGIEYTVTKDYKLYLFDRDTNLKNNLKLKTPKEWLVLSEHKKKVTCGIRRIEHIEMPEVNVEIDPYILGCWLGDGDRTSTTVIVNRTRDSEILYYFQKYAENNNLHLKIVKRNRVDYNDDIVRITLQKKNGNRGNNYGTNYLIPGLVEYNLFYNKHIPKDFIFNSLSVRRKLLAGFMDTDGYYDPTKGRYIIQQNKEHLIDELLIIIRSLGMYANKSKVFHKGHDNIRDTISYRLHVSLSDSQNIKCLIDRKKKRYQAKRRKNTSRVDITYAGVGPYIGFEIEDNLFLLADQTIAHDSSV